MNTLSRQNRRYAIVLATAAATAWASFRNGNLMDAWPLPDVQYYVLMAQGRKDLAPLPFTLRPLAPLLARAIAAAIPTWTEGGFEILAFLALLWTLLVVFWLMVRTGAPRWWLLAVAAVPFWTQLLSHAGLPDPLYAALLSCLLLALAKDRLWLAALLMLPLTLARESTTLTLACLLAVGWRQLRWTGVTLAIGCTALGALAVRRLSAGSLPNPEHLSGGIYMAGKIFSNTFRSLGVQPWSNVYPGLCPAPAWQTPLRLGAVRAIGVCAWSPQLLLLAWWALLTVFGALPPLLLAAAPGSGVAGLSAAPAGTPLRPNRWRDHARRALGRAAAPGGDLLLRFCLLYGGISLLLGPTLGVSYARLVGYGWPLLLVALPRLWAIAEAHPPGRPAPPQARPDCPDRPDRLDRSDPSDYPDRRWAGTLLVLHLLLCATGLLIETNSSFLLMAVLQSLVIALILVHRRHARDRSLQS